MTGQKTDRQTTAQVFAQTLKDIGIQYVFGIPSGPMIDWIQALHDTEGIDFVLTSHESGAAFMAGVCGRLTGIPGACFSTFGPGATNLSTGVGAAYLDRAPMLVFADEMPDHLIHRTVQMNIDQQALFAPITKQTSRLVSRTAASQLIEAAKLAISGIPGPVYLGMPSDTALRQVLQKKNSSTSCDTPADMFQPDLFKKIKHLLTTSRKPVLALGLAAAKSHLKPLINKMVNQFQIPVVLTPMAKGIVCEKNPLYAGVLNHARSDKVAGIHCQADLIISIGYDPVEINYEEWASDVPIIHLNPTPADIDSNMYPQVTSVCTDLKTSIETLLELPGFENDWNEKQVVENTARMFNSLKGNNDIFGPCRVLDILRDQLSDQGILTCDVGAHLHLAGQKWKTPEPDRLLMTNGWSSMGFAIPAAIAARICRPDLPVVGLSGDGGFLMAAGELATARRLNLKIIFILLVDHDLSLIRIKQDRKVAAAGYGTKISTADLFHTDSFLGIPVCHADSDQSFKNALGKAHQSKGPSIIKTIVDPSEYDGLVLRGNRPGPLLD